MVQNSVNPQVQKLNNLGQFCETLVLLSLTLIICGFIIINDGPQLLMWSSFWLIVMVLSFLGAWRMAARAIDTYKSAKFRITEQSRKALRAHKVPKELTESLANIGDKVVCGEDEFFLQVESAIGFQWCKEHKQAIFTYAAQPAGPGVAPNANPSKNLDIKDPGFHAQSKNAIPSQPAANSNASESSAPRSPVT